MLLWTTAGGGGGGGGLIFKGTNLPKELRRVEKRRRYCYWQEIINSTLKKKVPLPKIATGSFYIAAPPTREISPPIEGLGLGLANCYQKKKNPSFVVLPLEADFGQAESLKN